ncbi:ester cyclase [Modestobacter sp. URMC 112]
MRSDTRPRHRQPGGLQRVPADVRARLPGQRADLEQVVEGDEVGFWATYEGTQEEDFGPPASGRKATSTFAGVARLREDRIAELWSTWDDMMILGQLGHLPAPEPVG